MPKKEEVPALPQSGENMNKSKKEGVNPAPLNEDLILIKLKMKMTLLPPKKKDNPETARKY